MLYNSGTTKTDYAVHVGVFVMAMVQESLFSDECSNIKPVLRILEPCKGMVTRKCRICKMDFLKSRARNDYDHVCPKCNRNRAIKHKFNITQQQYDEILLAQNGVCALCGKPETKISHKSHKVLPLAIDHDHKTGKIRGLLCDDCNVMLGRAKDEAEVLRKAANYIEQNRAQIDA
jgi:sulfur transfer complex TusBCD TusB component (DsrH family)